MEHIEAKSRHASRYAIDNARRRASQFIMRRLYDVNHAVPWRKYLAILRDNLACPTLVWFISRAHSNPSRSNCREQIQTRDRFVASRYYCAEPFWVHPVAYDYARGYYFHRKTDFPIPQNPVHKIPYILEYPSLKSLLLKFDKQATKLMTLKRNAIRKRQRST